MSDPLSVTGSVVGIISPGLQVTQSLYNYYAARKSQDSDITHTLHKLENLLEILNCLQTHLNGRKIQADRTAVLESIESTIRQCEECIQELQEESRKFERTPVDGIRTAIRATGRRLAYPFRQSTLQKLDEDIDELVAHLSLALQVLQQDATGRVQDEIENTKAVLDLVRASQLSSQIQVWLKAPDASIDFNDACRKKHPGTGLWFIKSPSFISWLEYPRSFLWLKGFAGCGKSVLCSTAIQHAFRHRRSSANIGIAFFFFTFADEGKQDVSAMILALLLQLASQLGGTHTVLTRLYENYRTSTPPVHALLECLHQIVRSFRDVYVLIDALDESPRENHRDAMLQALNDIRAWSEPGLHLLVTSRDEVDIRDALEAVPEEIVVMKNDGIDKDIASFVSQHLRDSRRLRKWQEHHIRIEQALMEKAKGVFRWVECQLKALASCPRSEHLLEQRLQSLPQTLDETYERMLRNIPNESKEYARQMLAILCCAIRPLTVPELIDAIAVEVGDTASFNAKRRLGNVDDLQLSCPGFTELDVQRDPEAATVRIAHFSVQEYLESERIHTQTEASFFSVQRRKGNELMAVICLTLLLEPQLSTVEPSLVRDRYPLAKYAAPHWPRHYQQCAQGGLAESQVVRLFLEEVPFQAWVTIADVDGYRETRWRWPTPSPLYFASLLGIQPALRMLLKESGLDGSFVATAKSLSYNLDTVSGIRGAAIGAASYNGHQQVVQLLLEKGADPTVEGESRRTPICMASFGGHIEVVKLLLDKGADATVEDRFRQTPICIASSGGHIEVVKLLLDKGADATVEDRFRQTPIWMASSGGHIEVVKLLLEKGANATVADKHGETPIYRASARGHIEVVKLLLEKGADATVQTEHGETPIYRASVGGHIEVVKLLLEKGANAAVAVKDGWTPMHEASARGHIEVVKLFLRTPGINLNSPDRLFRTPLFVASRHGHHMIVQLLLEDSRISSSPTDWHGSTPLFAAVRNGHLKVVEILLARGASGIETQVQDGFGRTLQWWARRTGNSEIAELLEKHADRLGNPIHETDPVEVTSVAFKSEGLWCDGCTLRRPYKSIRRCDGGDIVLCGECFELGVRCPDETHTML